MKKNSLIKLTLILALAMTGGFLFSPKTYASYHSNRLIDNYVFIDSRSMTQSQIQSFLVGKNSYLAGYKDMEICSNDYMNSHFTHCGQKILASQIIYDAGVAYGLNPRVIMATLQKEQSLITDPSPETSQINKAMGYACPDTSGCDTTYFGFFNQVDWGTYQLRKNYSRSSGDTSWFPESGASYICSGATRYYSTGLYAGRNVTFYDDFGSAYTHFVIYNAATASLYCYTPHVYPGSSKKFYSGSYNFVTSYESWWGSTFANPIKITSIGSTSEAGGTAKVEFSLADAPTADVTIPLAVSDASEATLSEVTSITITQATWNNPSANAVTVKGLDDSVPDGNVRYLVIAGHPSSTDDVYGNLSSADSPNASMINIDNEIFPLGRPSDTPLVGDWDGDGKDSAGIWRAGWFYLDNNDDGLPDITARFGRSTDTPIVGDWDGDGKTGIGVRRGGIFYMDNNNDGISDAWVDFGKGTDKPVIGDWDGDGKDSAGVRRDSNKMFYFDNNNDGTSDAAATFGTSTDTPLTGDWNGDGKTTPGVWRQSIRTFYLSN